MTAFEEMAVIPELAEAVNEMGWCLPTDIQNESIPLILGGGDVLMAAETGSGKTGAFCIPIIQTVHESIVDSQHQKDIASNPNVKPVPTGKWAMNIYDRDPLMAIDVVRSICQSRDLKKWHGCRANKGVNKGSYYYEITVTDEGLCRVGWSTEHANLQLGTDSHGFGFGGTGKKSWSKTFETYGESYGLHDVIGCYIDFENKCIEWSKNGNDFGEAYTIEKNLINATFYPAITLKNAELSYNFGAEKFKFPPQFGSRGLSSAVSDHVVSSSKAEHISPPTPKVLNSPYALILEPSRELAEQTFNNVTMFKKYLKSSNIKEQLIVGGVNFKTQVSAINNGVDIIVGTPGRIADLISANRISLKSVRYLVLDEADALLSQGNWNMITRLHAGIPSQDIQGRRLQVIVCSATLHSFDVKKLAEKIMKFPVWIDLKGQDSVPETVHHVVIKIDPNHDNRWQKNGPSGLFSLVTDKVHSNDNVRGNGQEAHSEAVKRMKGVKIVEVINKFSIERAIIFCRTKLDCDNMERFLSRVEDTKHLKSVCLHSDRNAEERKANLASFKESKANLLICTDVAARGIDISNLPYVINVTLPDDKQNYVHRIGRVGRVDRMGLAISLVATVKEKVWYHSNCKNRGAGCTNTNLTTAGGCCIWYNEMQYLGAVEDHLGVTIDILGDDLHLAVNEFDGKVVYGQKRKKIEYVDNGHYAILKPSLIELDALERRAQSSYINLMYRNPFVRKR